MDKILTVKDFLNEKSPLEFVNAPESITFNGCKMNYVPCLSSDKNGNVTSVYQSPTANANGEYPILQIAVKKYKYRGTFRTKFDLESSFVW